MNASNAKEDPDMVAGDMADNEDESDTTTTSGSEIDFTAYYMGDDESNGDIAAGFAI